MQQIKIIYPEPRLVSASQISIWWDDAVANKELAPGDNPSLLEKAMDLDDLGKITLAPPDQQPKATIKRFLFNS